MPWHRWTPAFPKPMPAKEDASLQHQKFRYPKKKTSTSLHTAFVYELQHHQDSSLFLGGSLRWFEVPKKKIYLQLGCFPDMQVGESG
jgi:hypothetical protein